MEKLYKLNPLLPEDFSLAQALGKAYGMAYQYTPPTEYILDKILALEFPISHFEYDSKELINPFSIVEKIIQNKESISDAMINNDFFYSYNAPDVRNNVLKITLIFKI